MSVDSIDDLSTDNSFARLPGQFYTRLNTQPLDRPRLLHANVSVAHMLGLSDEALTRPEFLDVVSGNRGLRGGDTLAAVYSGHQFGVWAGQLGDGRAHLLGEVLTPQGGLELQLKGSGLTPYSRMGDGRAVIRSSVREYLASEAMEGLGIATTRALAVVTAQDPVYRETVERAAVVTRVSPTFVRFGSFEHWTQHPELMQALLDYIVDRFYPECRVDSAGDTRGTHATILRFLRAVIRRSAKLVADWQTVGFCHGVMNTDNMSIIGVTLDYGPYGFMDAFQIGHICNHTDTQGRYAWNAQPSVMHWNLYRLASALAVLGPEPDDLREQLSGFEPDFLDAYHSNLVRKFGLRAWQDADEAWVDDWWRLLHTQQADFTLSFRRLATVTTDPESFLGLFSDREAAKAWLENYHARIERDALPEQERIAQMNQANPVYVLRNHLAELAIQAAEKDDATEIDTLLKLLRTPYVERPGYEAYAAPAPDWARDLHVSCSS
ncbi:MAG TPA: YdiU family protein [Pusillimonas sp.]|uniref:protein adenylyltransferase SelO n=1 Tax=unclassified Pusillimonas TaxID=2640016 RepID=UPI0026018EF8|nr:MULTISPECIES: YdiU family protein [unclassified Pusillimonas]HLU18673.1 YdiU family protein [Pusillimonas sp.]